MQQARRMSDRVVVFTNRFPLIGPIFWILAVQYLIVQVIVATAWPLPYSWANHFIVILAIPNADSTTACMFVRRWRG